MKKYSVISLAFVSIIIILGCDYNTGCKELKAENERLKNEIEEVKYGSAKLMNLANEQYEKKDFAGAKKTILLLAEKHPDSAETKEANVLSDKINSVIQKEEKEKNKAEKLKIANALKHMRRSYDSMEGIAWYQDVSSPIYNNQNGFFLYFGVSDKNKTPSNLRFKIQYHADKWLFIESYEIKADNQKFDKSCYIERDHSTTIWEWSDTEASSYDLNMIKAVISSKKAIIRFNGKQYRNDKLITPIQKKALENVLTAFSALGGKL